MQRRTTSFYGPNENSAPVTNSTNGVTSSMFHRTLAPSHEPAVGRRGIASPPSPSSRAPGERGEVSLRDILERYANDEDMLRLVLTAKIEEDKRCAEYHRAISERACLERRRLEMEMMRQGWHEHASFSTEFVPRMRPRDTSSPHGTNATAMSTMAPIANHHTRADRTPPTSFSVPNPKANTLTVLTASPDSQHPHGMNTHYHGNGHTTQRPTFSDCLAYSPSDVTQMPPLPLPAGSSLARDMARSNSMGALTQPTEDEQSESAKKRRHDEVMRTVRERVLSKRRVQSMYEPSQVAASRARAGSTSTPTNVPAVSTAATSNVAEPPSVTGAALPSTYQDHRSVQLPPLQSTGHLPPGN